MEVTQKRRAVLQVELPEDWVPDASPEPGQPLLTKVERIAGPLRVFAQQLSRDLRVSEAEFRQIYAPRVGRLGFRVAQRDLPRRATWSLIAQWLAGFAIGEIDRYASLAEAEEWFLGSNEALPRIAPKTSVEQIADLLEPSLAFALLPYLLDPLAPGTRRSVQKTAITRTDRRARKSAGVYYTPGDLAQYMVQAVTANDAPTCLDPACGTGVFLRSARAGPGNPMLFGCDIDPFALEQCAFVLMATDRMIASASMSPWASWQLHRLNLATVDSLLLLPGSPLSEIEQRMRLKEVTEARRALVNGEVVAPAKTQPPHRGLGALFPDLHDGCGALLCNPPYARVGSHPHSKEIASIYASFESRPPSPSSDVSTPFVEHAWRLTNRDEGRAAIVVPLSVAFSRTEQFRGLRRGMASQRGRWRCSFFDRAPDALFGDDVKTRNSVLVYEANKPSGFETTPILRWTSKNRSRLFASIKHTDPGLIDITDLIPKVGSQKEAGLYRAVRSLPGQLVESVKSSGAVRAIEAAGCDHRRAVYVGPTAYNWLNAMRSLEAWGDGDGLSTSSFTRLEFADTTMADAVYALLSSRLVYWLWRVEGDAFHIPQRYLCQLPFRLETIRADELRELARLGSGMWAALRDQPLESLNKGRRTLSFPAQRKPEIVDRIDEQVIRAYGLRQNAHGFDLSTWYDRVVVVAGRRAKNDAPVLI